MSPTMFIVDPLDGTAEFASSSSHYCVSIGFIEEGEPEKAAL